MLGGKHGYSRRKDIHFQYGRWCFFHCKKMCSVGAALNTITCIYQYSWLCTYRTRITCLCYIADRRALSSSSVDGVCAMLNHACSILEQDFREVLYAKLRLGFPSGFDFATAYNFVQSSIQQGRLQNADTETEKAKTAFLVGPFLLQVHFA